MAEHRIDKIKTFGSRPGGSTLFPADLAETLPPDRIPEALGEIERLKAVLWGRMMAARPKKENHGDRLMTVKQAARRLNCSEGWIYAHADGLPFTRRMGRSLRFSEQGIQEYIEARNGR